MPRSPGVEESFPLVVVFLPRDVKCNLLIYAMHTELVNEVIYKYQMFTARWTIKYKEFNNSVWNQERKEAKRRWWISNYNPSFNFLLARSCSTASCLDNTRINISFVFFFDFFVAWWWRRQLWPGRPPSRKPIPHFSARALFSSFSDDFWDFPQLPQNPSPHLPSHVLQQPSINSPSPPFCHRCQNFPSSQSWIRLRKFCLQRFFHHGILPRTQSIAI